MEQLEIQEKEVSVTFLITKQMAKDIEILMRKNKWKRSAFIRVAIQESMDRLSK